MNKTSSLQSSPRSKKQATVSATKETRAYSPQGQINRQGSAISSSKNASPFKNINFGSLTALQNSGLLNYNLFQQKEDKKGIDVRLEDIEKAFKIIDEKNEGQKVTLNELRRRLLVINPSFPPAEIAALTNNKPEIRSKDLYDILKQNELEDFDPLSEAFKLLDPSGSGTLDIQRLKHIFQGLGYGDIDKKDVEILTECLDVDKDGKITLNDFKEIFNYMTKKYE